MIKITFIIESLKAGGKERQLSELINKLATDSDFNITIVLFHDEIAYDTNSFKEHITILPQGSTIRQYRSFKRIIKAAGPDIIHAWGVKSAVFANLASFFTKTRSINGSIRSAYPPGKEIRTKILQMIASRCSSINIANSKAGLHAMRLNESKKNRVIYNGYRQNRTQTDSTADETKKRWNIITPKIAGMVANFTSYKDYVTYLSAISLVLQSRNDVTFMAVGDGPLLRPMKERYNHKNIIYTGKVTHPEELITIFDIGILASLIEGCPNVVLEYMAMGKPVIATDGGGTPELFTDGIEGYLVPVRDMESIVEKIHYLLDKPEKAKEMGERGKLKIKRTFAYETMIQKYIDLYRELCVE